MSYDDSNSDVEGADLLQMRIHPYDIDGHHVVDEIQDCRIIVSRPAAVELTHLGILKFIV